MRSFSALVITVLIFTAIDLYTFKGLRQISENWNHKVKVAVYLTHWLVPILMLFLSIVMMLYRDQMSYKGQYSFFAFFAGFMILSYVPKMFFVAFHLLDDTKSLLAKLVALPFDAASPVARTAGAISRSRFLTQLGLMVAAVPFASIAWGILRGRFNYTVVEQTLSFENLPPAFDGLRVLQVSDMHMGSFDESHREQVEAGIAMINEQQADLILFTGDMVNNISDELEGWVPLLARMEAKMGKYAILGNHDYGDYYRDWTSAEHKAENLRRLIAMQQEMGFKTLLNEGVRIEKDGQSFGLLGVENWGQKPFPQYGDLAKALAGVREEPFKLLMSHDPTHWSEQVLAQSDVDLTLSGHTHGMQFAFRIPGWRWSPVSLRYKHWGGLYSEGKRHLYVNIGFGFIAFPGRVGTPPEITVFTLRSAKA